MNVKATLTKIVDDSDGVEVIIAYLAGLPLHSCST